MKIRPPRTRIALGLLVLTTLLGTTACTEKKSLHFTQGAERLAALYGPALASGLMKKDSAITLNEFDTINGMVNEKGVVSLLYLNSRGEVRWSSDPKLITTEYHTLAGKINVPVEGIEAALKERRIKSFYYPDKPHRYFIIPIQSQGKPLGVMLLGADLGGLARLIKNAGQLVKKSVKYPARSTHLNSTAFSSHYLNGIVYYQNLDLDKAEKHWELANLLKPDDPDVQEGLARLKTRAPEEYARACRRSHEKGMLEKAVALCRRCAELDPAFRFCGKILDSLARADNLPGLVDPGAGVIKEPIRGAP